MASRSDPCWLQQPGKPVDPAWRTLPVCRPGSASPTLRILRSLAVQRDARPDASRHGHGPPHGSPMEHERVYQDGREAKAPSSGSLPRPGSRLAVAAAAFFLFACNGNGQTYTLYRSSVIADDAAARIHVATFDAHESGPTYNQENCLLAAKLFLNQPGVTVRYWCEKGTYRP